MTREEYERFVEALLAAETIPLRDFEREEARFFEACLPIEEIARRGREALAFGPMRPVGLVDPRTGKRPYAVVQLRRDDLAGRLYNLVGFQTNLRWKEQERVFRLIPGLERAEFVRYGQMHRNTYLHSPSLLRPTLQSVPRDDLFRLIPGLERAEFVRYGQMHRNTYLHSPSLLRPTLQCVSRDDLFFAGQLTGSEGYVGSIGTGLLAGVNAARLLRGEELWVLPPTTMLGALVRYITTPRQGEFQPMKANFGLLPELPNPPRGKPERNRAYAERALRDLDEFLKEQGL